MKKEAQMKRCVQLGQKIQEARLTRGYSRSKLAEKIDMHRQQLEKFEKGTNRISVPVIEDLANVLEFPVNMFMTASQTESFSNVRLTQYHMRKYQLLSAKQKKAVNVVIDAMVD